MEKYSVNLDFKLADDKGSNTGEIQVESTNFSDDDVFSFIALVEPEEKDQTKMKKIITLTKKSSDSIKEDILIIEISPEGFAEITHPDQYDNKFITRMVEIANSISRKPGENLNYDENYAKDVRDDGTVIFSMVLNTIICKKNNTSKVLYFPEPIDMFEDENREDNDARGKFQKRISSHMFESVEKIQQSENKPNFIFIPYKISIYGGNGQQSHELLLVFDMKKKKGEKGYVKYFDSSHFTQTIPNKKIKTVFPNPPFPNEFGLNKSGLINQEDIFQTQEGSISCSYWSEAFLLTMLETDYESIKEIINGQLRVSSFKERVKNKFKELRKTQFKYQQQTIQNITNPIDIFRQHNIIVLPEEVPDLPQNPRRVPTERRRFNESGRNRYQPTPKEITLRTQVRHRKPNDFKERNPKKFSPGYPSFH